ncbi:MAG: SGNH/GDSL hydrolase family protein [Alphaproteobacteria bacterium]|nr:SGNH/GDSL hydrolase family protein [Alphaproteobacteria bacterium]
MTHRRLPLALLLPAALLPACVPDLCPEVDALPDLGDVLAIGDSIQAWNKHRCQGVPDHVGLLRGARVENAAISGTKLLSGGNAIPGQYQPGDWTTVLVDGGANDLNDDCGCNECAYMTDVLVSQDGSGGAMPDLLDTITADGADVLLLGYYRFPDGAAYGFDQCGDELSVLNARYQTAAALREGVTFVDLGQVVQPDVTPQYYDFDSVHPSAEGAEAMAALLLQFLDEPSGN